MTGPWLVAGIPFSPHVFWFYMFYPPMLQAVLLTVIISVIAQSSGIVLGTFTALGRMSTLRAGPRFVFFAFVSAALAALVSPVLHGQFNDWWNRHVASPPGTIEDWLTAILAACAAASLIFGVWGLMRGATTPRLASFSSQSWYPLRSIAGAYIWLFRGTPLLVQLAFVYFVIPSFTNYGFTWTGALSPAWAATIALGLNEGAYMSEIVRAGITSVAGGQMEAAQSLGMTRGLAMRRIVLPQAIRIIIPPTGNEFISILKNSSLAYSIGVIELWGQSRLVFTGFGGLGGGRYFELITVAATWYLILTTVFSFFQVHIERHFQRGFVRQTSESMTTQFLHDLGGRVTSWRRVAGSNLGGNG